MGQNNKKKNKNEFFKELKERSNGHLILLSDYVNNKTEITVLCTEQNKTFTTKPNYLTDSRCNYSCPLCSGKRKKSLNDFLDEIKDKTNDRFIYKSGEFKNNKSVLLFYDKETKKNIKTDCRRLLMKYGRIDNIESYFKSDKHKEFISKIKDNPLFSEFEILTPYINNERPIKLKHKCGTIIERMPRSIKDTMTCPKCNNSHNSAPVKFIEDYLNEKDIEFEREKRFDNCKNINFLPFDFYISDFNLLLEYDGSQHIRGYKGNKENLETTIENDKLKNSFIRETGEFNLIRIPESEVKNLKSILDSIFINKTVPENILFIPCSIKTTLIAGTSETDNQQHKDL